MFSEFMLNFTKKSKRFSCALILYVHKMEDSVLALLCYSDIVRILYEFQGAHPIWIFKIVCQCRTGDPVLNGGTEIGW